MLEAAAPYGVSKAPTEVLLWTRLQSPGGQTKGPRRRGTFSCCWSAPAWRRREFASRIGVTGADLSAFLDATVSPPASLMIRMRRLSDRFAKMRAQRAQDRSEMNNSDGYFQSGPG